MTTSKPNLKINIIKRFDTPYYQCQFSGVIMDKRYAISIRKKKNDTIDYKGTFHDPISAAAWVQIVHSQGRLKSEIKTKYFKSIMQDLELDHQDDETLVKFEQQIITFVHKFNPLQPVFPFAEKYISRYEKYLIPIEKDIENKIISRLNNNSSSSSSTSSENKSSYHLYQFGLDSNETQYSPIKENTPVDLDNINSVCVSKHKGKTIFLLEKQHSGGDINNKVLRITDGKVKMHGDCYGILSKPITRDDNIEKNPIIKEKKTLNNNNNNNNETTTTVPAEKRETRSTKRKASSTEQGNAKKSKSK